jgi:class 3 adenylate cyclase/tetratricopeptide (TPR) repeat protein
MMTCTACGGENPEGFRFCGTCGSPLERNVVVPREARKTITVLFCDLAGSTALGERLEPESLQQMMRQYFERTREVLERHEGSVEKFIGDAVVGVFGIPRLHEDDALRAVRAAVELQTTIAQLNKKLERELGVMLHIRIGVNTGEVIVGSPAVGSAQVLGDTANVAARLEQAAAPGEALLGHTTWQLVRDRVQAERITPLALKGKAAPVAAWRLLAVNPDVPSQGRRRQTPMVGRERQRQRLLDAFDRVAAERTCLLVTVLGSAGVGKTRLVEEVFASLSERATVLRGRCLSHGKGITYWPVAEIVRQAAGIAHTDTLESARSKLAALLAGEGQAEQIASQVAATVGLTEAAGGIEETFWALRRLFDHLGRLRPLVVAFDDLHWAEPTLLDLIDYLHQADVIRTAPMLLVGLARTELLDARPDWGTSVPAATTMTLESLSNAESDRLVQQLLGTAMIDRHALAQISTQAGGNPLFIEELVAKLIDDGLLRREDHRWIASPELDQRDIPATIQVLLAARLEQLPDNERAVLERASVVGKTFLKAAVAALLSESEHAHLGRNLASLVRRDLLRLSHSAVATDSTFEFRHDLIRDAAYKALLKRERAELHGRFATWLEATVADRVGETEEIVAYHLERASHYRAELGVRDLALARRAADRLAAAGQRASDRWDHPAAIGLLVRARAVLPADDPASLEVIPALVANLGVHGSLEAAKDLARKGISQARLRNERRVEARIQIEHSLIEQMLPGATPSWSASTVLHEVELAIPLFEQAGDSQGLGAAWYLVGRIEWLSLRCAAMEAAVRRAIEHFRAGGSFGRMRFALQLLSHAYWYGPVPVPEAIRRCEELAREAGDNRAVRAVIQGCIACMEAMRGDYPRAGRRLDEAFAVLQEMGQIVGWMPWAVYHECGAFIARLERDYQRMEASLRNILDERTMANPSIMLASDVAWLAEAVDEQGRHAEAAKLCAISERLAPVDDMLSQLFWRSVKARALANIGRVWPALRLTNEAVQLAERTDALNWQANAWMDQARVLRLAGRDREANHALRGAVERYQRKGNVVSAAAAHSQLAEG